MASFNTLAEYHQGFTNTEPTVSYVSLSNLPFCPGFEAKLASPVPAHLDAQAWQGMGARRPAPQRYAILLTPEDKGRSGMVDHHRQQGRPASLPSSSQQDIRQASKPTPRTALPTDVFWPRSRGRLVSKRTEPSATHLHDVSMPRPGGTAGQGRHSESSPTPRVEITSPRQAGLLHISITATDETETEKRLLTGKARIGFEQRRTKAATAA
ncbi:hypothetical protein CMUS01_11902 [Colletotrichum musicola]|uniref:Uncharacterized protein n=1 Tax=Colletotrichum musicola TaxID=2175873 RepID=A0A8H6N346_9PEZI|nr:hypothetical protein CMUS01_11902 [Colletotrichum musicola]